MRYLKLCTIVSCLLLINCSTEVKYPIYIYVSKTEDFRDLLNKNENSIVYVETVGDGELMWMPLGIICNSKPNMSSIHVEFDPSDQERARIWERMAKNHNKMILLKSKSETKSCREGF